MNVIKAAAIMAIGMLVIGCQQPTNSDVEPESDIILGAWDVVETEAGPNMTQDRYTFHGTNKVEFSWVFEGDRKRSFYEWIYEDGQVSLFRPWGSEDPTLWERWIMTRGSNSPRTANDEAWVFDKSYPCCPPSTQEYMILERAP